MPDTAMQDIIASISRIIDEEARTLPVRNSSRDKSGILELTDVIEPHETVQNVTADVPPDTGAAKEPAAMPLLPTAEETSAAAAGRSPASLVSASASAAAIAAFGRLGAAAAGETLSDPGPLLGAGDRTLEDIVRDTLRPLLQAWLDEHLPAMVERLVLEEIQRLVRDARLR
jgi:uncharacterized protein